VTTARTPRAFREEIVDLKGDLDKLLEDYEDAYDHGHWPPSRGGGGGGRRLGRGDADPTSATFHAGGRARGLLRKLNRKLNRMVELAGEAQDLLEEIFEQDPLSEASDKRPAVRIPSPAAAVHEESGT
jgi:hypothetical protein